MPSFNFHEIGRKTLKITALVKKPKRVNTRLASHLRSAIFKRILANQNMIKKGNNNQNYMIEILMESKFVIDFVWKL